jgi:hypothetical protein
MTPIEIDPAIVQIVVKAWREAYGENVTHRQAILAAPLLVAGEMAKAEQQREIDRLRGAGFDDDEIAAIRQRGKQI